MIDPIQSTMDNSVARPIRSRKCVGLSLGFNWPRANFSMVFVVLHKLTQQYSSKLKHSRKRDKQLTVTDLPRRT